MTGVDEINPENILKFEKDLTTYTPSPEASFAVHDGTGTPTEGLYWRDRVNQQWVKVSTNSPTNSVTIAI